MQRMRLGVVILLSIGLFPAPVALAAEEPPVGTCPTGFHLHEFHSPGMHEHGHHVGLEVDLNDNGWFCAMHLKSGLHVHTDDVVKE